MRLDDITTHIRLRSAWEAVDLGFAMAQRYWRDLWSVWSLLLVAWAVLVWGVMPVEYKGYVPLVIWWLKPLYDRILLFFFSHKLFNQPVSASDIVSHFPSFIRNTGLLGALTWRRFSMSRGFNLPIWQLEGLRGKPRAERQNLLHMHAHSHAVWVTIACLHLEMVVIFSLYALILLLDPTEGAWNFFSDVLTNEFDEDNRYWGELIYVLLYTIGVWLVEPLYVAANFSLYINRRTQLEAWDIELTFRSLGERLRAGAVKTLGIVLMFGVVAHQVVLQPAWAEPEKSGEYLASEPLSVEKTPEVMRAVMDLDEFSRTRKVERWEERNKKDNQNKELTSVEDKFKGVSAIFALFFKIVLWCLLIAACVLLVVYRKKILAMLSSRKRGVVAPPPPDILFGMDIRPESLRTDIAGTCRQLWHAGQQREALSLLYRAALMRLTRHDQLLILNSHTEGDILTLAGKQVSGTRFTWLEQVTTVWQSIAYAHRTPSSENVLLLFDSWDTFAANNETNASTEASA